MLPTGLSVQDVETARNNTSACDLRLIHFSFYEVLPRRLERRVTG
jgi:hypothetical protein